MATINLKPASTTLAPRKARDQASLLQSALPAPSKPEKRILEGVVASKKVSIVPDMDERGKPRKAGTRPRVELTDEQIDGAGSVMNNVVQEILDLLDAEDADNAITLTQKMLLRTVLTIIPEAERIIRASKTARGVHNFNVLLNQTRELMADIQMSRDNQYLATGVNQRILQPGMIDIANMLVTSHSILKQQIMDVVPPEHKATVNSAVDGTTKTIARHIEGTYRSMATKVEKHLGG